MEKSLPDIPAKRYFTIGEVSELCGVKAYVLRYWEQEFSQLKPQKRRGNRRYYQRHEVLLVRRIRELLYDHGFTIAGARNKLAEGSGARAPLANSGGERETSRAADAAISVSGIGGSGADDDASGRTAVGLPANESAYAHAALQAPRAAAVTSVMPELPAGPPDAEALRLELLSIRSLLTF